MDNYICNCDSCEGCNVKLEWQSQFFMQSDDNLWHNIVMWEDCCCIPQVMSYVIWMDKEILDEAQVCDLQRAAKYEDLRQCIIVENNWSVQDGGVLCFLTCLHYLEVEEEVKQQIINNKITITISQLLKLTLYLNTYFIVANK